MEAVMSPNGGSIHKRRALHERFAGRMAVNSAFTRKTVSYQGNRAEPGLRWMKYKEGFSRSLVESLIEEHDPADVLDPFAGIGTTPLVATGMGRAATGMEIMPVGVLAGAGIAEAANGVSKPALESAGNELLAAVASEEPPRPEFAFPHVGITKAAFPDPTEAAIARARQFVAGVDDRALQALLNLACMTVLEDVSYTRKDGQYLRWDHRSGRRLRARMSKGPILAFERALASKLFDMAQDVDALKRVYGGGLPGTADRFVPGTAERAAGRTVRHGDNVAAVREQVRLHADVRAGTGLARLRPGRVRTSQAAYAVRYG